jgi:hypothetical protein
MSEMVESARTTMPRSRKAAWISARVMCGRLLTRLRSRPAWASRMGRRWPPIWAGAVLPLSRTRRMSLMTADGLTSKRMAAQRLDEPASTARRMRMRRS